MGKPLTELQRPSGGLWNVFLVRAEDLGGAIQGTRDVLLAGKAVDEPVAGNPDSKKIWAAAYLGWATGSGWELKSAQLSGNTIRLSYVDLRDLKAAGLTIRAYYYWVPLGELPAGRYVIELYDEKAKQVTVSRGVTVP